MSDREDGRLWYAHSPEDHTTLHFTADEAEAAAQAEMQYYRDCAENDIWHEDIDVLSWGEMIPHGEARCIERKPAEDSPYDYEEDWQLIRLPVAEPAVSDDLVTATARATRLIGRYGEDPFVEALRERGYSIEMDQEDD